MPSHLNRESPKRLTLQSGITLVAIFFLVLSSQFAFAFSFSEEEERIAREEESHKAETSARVTDLLSIACKDRLKEKKIAVVIGERHGGSGTTGRISAVDGGGAANGKPGSPSTATIGMLFNEINLRLRKVGLKTYSQREISAQIAQAEMAAFLNNNMDAAASAASRLGANFFLKGVIDSYTRVNPLLGINEVFVTMAFTLVNASGRIISDVTARADAFSGQDTFTVALELVREQADLIVARLYHDYCSSK